MKTPEELVHERFGKGLSEEEQTEMEMLVMARDDEWRALQASLVRAIDQAIHHPDHDEYCDGCAYRKSTLEVALEDWRVLPAAVPGERT